MIGLTSNMMQHTSIVSFTPFGGVFRLFTCCMSGRARTVGIRRRRCRQVIIASVRNRFPCFQENWVEHVLSLCNETLGNRGFHGIPGDDEIRASRRALHVYAFGTLAITTQRGLGNVQLSSEADHCWNQIIAIAAFRGRLVGEPGGGRYGQLCTGAGEVHSSGGYLLLAVSVRKTTVTPHLVWLPRRCPPS